MAHPPSGQGCLLGNLLQLPGKAWHDQEEQVRLSDLQLAQHVKSAHMLVTANSVAIAGFLLCPICTFTSFLTERQNGFNQPYPSGHGFFPSSISEAISDVDDTIAHVVFATCLATSTMLFLSWYPYTMYNAYVGVEDFPGGVLTWTTFRQFVPPTGCFILGAVPMANKAHLRPVENLSAMVHLCGAAMLFAGYFVSEARVVGFCGLQSKTPPALGDAERRCRRWMLGWFSSHFLIFTVAYVLDHAISLFLSDHIICCQDKWATYTYAVNATSDKGPAMQTLTISRMTLVDTASRWVLANKMVSYMFEVSAIIGLVCSHMAVWYFAKDYLEPKRPLLGSAEEC